METSLWCRRYYRTQECTRHTCTLSFNFYSPGTDTSTDTIGERSDVRPFPRLQVLLSYNDDGTSFTQKIVLDLSATFQSSFFKLNKTDFTFLSYCIQNFKCTFFLILRLVSDFMFVKVIRDSNNFTS